MKGDRDEEEGVGSSEDGEDEGWSSGGEEEREGNGDEEGEEFRPPVRERNLVTGMMHRSGKWSSVAFEHVLFIEHLLYSYSNH